MTPSLSHHHHDDHHLDHSPSNPRSQVSTPDYATLEFNPASVSSRTSSRLQGKDHHHLNDYQTNTMVMRPKRGIKPAKSPHPHHHHPYASHRCTTPASQRIYQNVHHPMYMSRSVTSHTSDQDEDAVYDERDRQFATAICE